MKRGLGHPIDASGESVETELTSNADSTPVQPLSVSDRATQPFWETTPLEDLDDQQWESLCDGCGRCCLQKLEDIDTGELFYTRISCRLLDLATCRCRDYTNRKSIIPDCVNLRPLTEDVLRWLPETCAYKLLAEGQSLYDWHPLVSGNKHSVEEAGISVRAIALPEDKVADERYEDHIINFDALSKE